MAWAGETADGGVVDGTELPYAVRRLAVSSAGSEPGGAEAAEMGEDARGFGLAPGDENSEDALKGSPSRAPWAETKAAPTAAVFLSLALSVTDLGAGGALGCDCGTGIPPGSAASTGPLPRDASAGLASSAGWLVDGEWPEGADSTYAVVRLEVSAEGSQFEAAAPDAALFPEKTECSAPFSEVVCSSGADGVFPHAAYRVGCTACEPTLRLTGGVG
jgi:hypothetical protein